MRVCVVGAFAIVPALPACKTTGNDSDVLHVGLPAGQAQSISPLASNTGRPSLPCNDRQGGAIIRFTTPLGRRVDGSLTWDSYRVWVTDDAFIDAAWRRFDDPKKSAKVHRFYVHLSGAPEFGSDCDEDYQFKIGWHGGSQGVFQQGTSPEGWQAAPGYVNDSVMQTGGFNTDWEGVNNVVEIEDKRPGRQRTTVVREERCSEFVGVLGDSGVTDDFVLFGGSIGLGRQREALDYRVYADAKRGFLPAGTDLLQAGGPLTGVNWWIKGADEAARAKLRSARDGKVCITALWDYYDQRKQNIEFVTERNTEPLPVSPLGLTEGSRSGVAASSPQKKKVTAAPLVVQAADIRIPVAGPVEQRAGTGPASRR